MSHHHLILLKMKTKFLKMKLIHQIIKKTNFFLLISIKKPNKLKKELNHHLQMMKSLASPKIHTKKKMIKKRNLNLFLKKNLFLFLNEKKKKKRKKKCLLLKLNLKNWNYHQQVFWIRLNLVTHQHYQKI